MSVDVVQTLVNAVLLIGVTLVAGTIGLRRFEAIDRRFEAIDRRFEATDRAIAELRTEFRTELKQAFDVVDGHLGELRAEIAQLRSDLTQVALAVGARRAEGSA